MVGNNRAQVTVLGLVIMFLVGVGGFLTYHLLLTRASQNILVKVKSATEKLECHFTLFSIYNDYIKYGGATDLNGNKELLEQYYENMSEGDFPIIRYAKGKALYEDYRPQVSIYEGGGGICQVKVFDPYKLHREKTIPYRTVSMRKEG